MMLSSGTGVKCSQYNEQFIWEVKTLHEPGIIVALDRQLDDIARFCTNENNFGILTVNPTFNLGEFDVTVTIYHHNNYVLAITVTSPASVHKTYILKPQCFKFQPQYWYSYFHLTQSTCRSICQEGCRQCDYGSEEN